jgi:translation elongation factor EF-Ts
VKNPDVTVAQLLKDAAASSRGPVQVTRFVRYQIGA